MKLGIIGYGSRIHDVIKHLFLQHPDCQIKAIVDIRNDEISRQLNEIEKNQISFFDNPEAMLAETKLDGILIGTRCSSHAEMVLRVNHSGIPIFLEKPVAINKEDLIRLKEGYEKTNTPVVVSFPLRVSPLVKKAKEIIDSGQLGSIEHVQAVNNVPYGGVYYQNWYRDENETGGLFLQKATHDFDYINHLLGLRPTMISAMVSKQIFKGDKAKGLQCVNCDEQHTCLESATLKRKNNEKVVGEYCCFAQDTGNEDSGSAMIKYETGMHVSYSQNFFARNKAAKRGACFLGYKGTLEFDFYTNELKVYMHHSKNTETHYIDPGKDGHAGGDAVLAHNFFEVMQGKSKSVAPLESGILSALMCIQARESSKKDTFETI